MYRMEPRSSATIPHLGPVGVTGYCKTPSYRSDEYNYRNGTGSIGTRGESLFSHRRRWILLYRVARGERQWSPSLRGVWSGCMAGYAATVRTKRSRVPHDKLQVSQIVRPPTCGEPRINQWEILEDPTHPRVSAVNINDSLNFLSNNCQDKPHDRGFL